MDEKRSLFITIEGGEGTGKTTLIQRLLDSLLTSGLDVVATREPGGTKLGEKIREWVLNQDANVAICDYAELMLFLAARTQHIDELIEPALSSGKVVLCDRFNDSTIAYQGAARGLGVDAVKQQCELACHGVLPDLTLFLDVDVEIGIERTKKTAKDTAQQGAIDRIESEEMNFHRTVRKAMQDLASDDPKRIVTIDASLPLEVVYQKAIDVVMGKLNEKMKGSDV
ncbi:MAG: dTMP kinase [Chlamydiota bacterium]|nr:dTMP kinase [Chlamydiota bacterium]